MKQLIQTTTAALSVTATAFAGTPAQVTAPPPAPAPAPGGWFVGGTFGQFDSDSNLADLIGLPTGVTQGDIDVDDAEFDMYTLHVGRQMGQFIGCDVAAYLEVGYLNGDLDAHASFYNSFNEDYDFGWNDLTQTIDLDIIPVTINFSLERPLFGPVSGYLSAGLGYAFTDAEIDGESDNDGGFYAQASFGLLYNINEQFEVFGGGRWLHLESLDFGDADFELDDSLAWEIGLRYNF